ncbi:hypothetical protein PHYPSEUDO_003993 [Phytophthora pseudosyringae]|uniref:Uncharacterized protein n=1 Tax=Phytophthora pseudosyringae TaxID=221518 RepID=A0A8T1VPU3_9STRA|nr:hypothetical protein PHYPSEUDO_003993 [Phytophthora pseudosyringae]
MLDPKAPDQGSFASSQGLSRQLPSVSTAPVTSTMGSLPSTISTTPGLTTSGDSSSVLTPATTACLTAGPTGLVPAVPVPAPLRSMSSPTSPPIFDPVPQSVRIPASLTDMARRECLEQGPDGLCDREMLPLLRCFGVEGFYAQVLGSLQLLRVLLDRVQALQTGLSGTDLAATNVQLSSKRLHSRPAGVVSSSDQTGIGAQKLRILNLENRLKALGSQYDDAVAEGQHFRDQAQSQALRIAELEAKLDKAGRFSPTGLLDFIMTKGKAEGF